MTDPNPPDQKPTGPKPAEPSQPSPGAYLSPRLREKLGTTESTSDEWPPKGGSRLPVILVGVAVLAVAVGGFLGWRSVAQKQKAKETAAAAAHAESLATEARAESLALAARADSGASAADSGMGGPGGGTASAARGTPAPAGGATATHAAAGAKTPAVPGTSASAVSKPAAAAMAPAPATSGYGIAVGTFLLEDRAQSERDRLTGLTGLAGIVAPTDEGYRVILGKFASRGPAEKKASALADSGLVREAHVVPRPK